MAAVQAAGLQPQPHGGTHAGLCLACVYRVPKE
nr:MAG TPA: hypothetical protein [Inoviridae sp.]